MTNDKPDLAEVAAALGGAPTATAEPEETEGQRKMREDREIFEKLDIQYSDAKPKPKEKPRESKDTPKAEEPEEKTEEVAEKPKEETPPEESPEAIKARDFLKLRASAPASAIEKLEPEEAIKWAATVARTVAETDRAFMDRADLQKEVTRLNEAATESEPEISAVPAETVDFDAIETQLSQQFGEDEGKTLRGVFEEVIGLTVEPYVKRVAELEQTFNQARQENTKAISRANQERLSATLPILKTSELAWPSVERAVIDLARQDPSRYASAEEFFDEAVRSLYGDLVTPPKAAEAEKEQEEDEVEEKKDQVADSTPTTKTKRKPTRKMEPKESDFEVFKSLARKPGDIRAAQIAGQVR